LSVACDLLESAETDKNFFRSITIDNETWVYGYDPKTKQHLSHWALSSLA